MNCRAFWLTFNETIASCVPAGKDLPIVEQGGKPPYTLRAFDWHKICGRTGCSENRKEGVFQVIQMDIRLAKRLPFHRLPVFPVLLGQLLVMLLLAAFLCYWRGNVSGYSGLCGGLIAWLPNVYFTYKAFRFSGARAARAIVRSFYVGEAGKVILTAVLFALVFAGVRPLDALALFGVFLSTQVVNWFAPLLMNIRFIKP
jgi:ATP synthase protein I